MWNLCPRHRALLAIFPNSGYHLFELNSSHPNLGHTTSAGGELGRRDEDFTRAIATRRCDSEFQYHGTPF